MPRGEVTEPFLLQMTGAKPWDQKGGLFWRLQSMVTWALSTSQELSHPLSPGLYHSVICLGSPSPPPPNTLLKGSQSPYAELKCLEGDPCGRAPYQIGSKRVRFTQKVGRGKKRSALQVSALAIDSAPFARGGSESWAWPETARQVQKQAWSLSQILDRLAPCSPGLRGGNFPLPTPSLLACLWP